MIVESGIGRSNVKQTLQLFKNSGMRCELYCGWRNARKGLTYVSALNPNPSND